MPFILELSFSAIAIVLLLIYFKRKNNKTAKLPKGLPFLGNILQIVKNPHLKFSKWAQEYGSVYTISLVGQSVLVVNDVKTMKEIFGSLASTGKFESICFEIMNEGKHDISNAEGQVWQEQHKFCMKALKQFGLGSGAKLDPVILQECNDLCEWIDDQLKVVKSGEGLHFSKILLQVTGTLSGVWLPVKE